jgi:hypothetical protein
MSHTQSHPVAPESHPVRLSESHPGPPFRGPGVTHSLRGQNGRVTPDQNPQNRTRRSRINPFAGRTFGGQAPGPAESSTL